MNRRVRAIVIAVLAAALPAAALAAPPVAVSPGGPDTVGRVGSVCPTFSWTYDPEATAVELTVYRLEAADGALAPEEAPPVLAVRLPAGAVSWTPDADRCLEADASYAWFVRSEAEEVPGPWSEGNLFEIAAGTPATAAPAAPGSVRREPDAAAEKVSHEPSPSVVPGRRAVPVGATGSAPVEPARIRLPRFPVTFQTDGSVAIAGSYQFTEPKAFDYFVPASAFQLRRSDEEDGWELKEGYGFVTRVSGTAGDIELVAALTDLPGRAKLRQFDCHAFDNVELDEAPGEPDIEDLFFHMDLVSHRPESTSLGEVVATAELLTEGATPEMQSNPSAVVDHTISPADGYRIEGLYRAESQGSFLRFYGCTLRLEISEIDPR